eukprot:TRINITY_DN1272_c0_g1_i4.p1 TRINITY_DN1272_c0_g1~~TRINITY_DN1272_c0_g1_i4.p1  ORF type:complete len:338 (+),score=110.66 TRINITY_DN1272_c0_g1_i4:207-1220(+)
MTEFASPQYLSTDSDELDPWLITSTHHLSLTPINAIDPYGSSAKHSLAKKGFSTNSVSSYFQPSTLTKDAFWTVDGKAPKQQQQQQQQPLPPRPTTRSAPTTPANVRPSPKGEYYQVDSSSWDAVPSASQPAPRPKKKPTQAVIAVVDPSQIRDINQQKVILTVDLEEELTQQNLYKTELCRSFAETNTCRYGLKCQFAHGRDELRPIIRHPKYKTEICKTFHTTGTCPYGSRCRFIHSKARDITDDDQWSTSWSQTNGALPTIMTIPVVTRKKPLRPDVSSVVTPPLSPSPSIGELQAHEEEEVENDNDNDNEEDEDDEDDEVKGKRLAVFRTLTA